MSLNISKLDLFAAAIISTDGNLLDEAKNEGKAEYLFSIAEIMVAESDKRQNAKSPVESEWISIDDDLPPIGKDFKVLSDTVPAWNNIYPGTWWKAYYNHADGTWRDHNYSENVIKPTHWLLMPDPLKETD